MQPEMFFDEGEGWEIVRAIPVCALTGQAAGTAAALVAKQNIAVEKLDAVQVQTDAG